MQTFSLRCGHSHCGANFERRKIWPKTNTCRTLILICMNFLNELMEELTWLVSEIQVGPVSIRFIPELRNLHRTWRRFMFGLWIPDLSQLTSIGSQTLEQRIQNYGRSGSGQLCSGFTLMLSGLGQSHFLTLPTRAPAPLNI